MNQSFALELEAFELVKETPGAASSYLRHNLLANITFLLEISSRFKEAAGVWRRAFERYLATDSQSFKSVFAARLGQLLFKNGERGEGTAALEEARDLSRRIGDPFHEEEVCIALGWAYSSMGEVVRAHDAYRGAFDIARRLRDLDICDASLSGMLWCLAAAGADEEFEALREAVVAAVPGTRLAERLAAAPAGDPREALRAGGVQRPLPSPKLRAYIASVDLEGTPRQDLNRYLVWSRGPLAGNGAGHARSSDEHASSTDAQGGAMTSTEALADTPFLAVCGSRKPAPGIQRPSAARELLRAVVQGMAEAGADAGWLDLRDLDLPQFDGRPADAYGSPDLERAREQVLRSRVVVLSVPAYWQGPAGVVKNFLDLVGGPAYDAPPDQPPPLAGKVVALLVVGADRGSGHSALGAMRLTLGALGAWTAPRAAVVGDLREVRNTAALLASLKEFGRYVAGLAPAPVPEPSVGASR